MFRQCRSRIGHISLARPASPVGRPCQCKRARHCQSYSMPNRSRGHDQLVPVRQQFAPLWSDRVVNELVILPSLARQPYPSTWNPGVSILNAYWRIFIWSGSSRACAFGNRRFALHPVQPGRVENRRNGGGRRVDVLAVLPRIVNGGNGHRVQVLYFSTCWVARWVAAMASFSTRFIRILAICASALSSKLLASTRSNYEGALDSAAAPSCSITLLNWPASVAAAAVGMLPSGSSPHRRWQGLRFATAPPAPAGRQQRRWRGPRRPPAHWPPKQSDDCRRQLGRGRSVELQPRRHEHRKTMTVLDAAAAAVRGKSDWSMGVATSRRSGGGVFQLSCKMLAVFLMNLPRERFSSIAVST
jgi:hypothetical protein